MYFFLEKLNVLVVFNLYQHTFSKLKIYGFQKHAHSKVNTELTAAIIKQRIIMDDLIKFLFNVISMVNCSISKLIKLL